MKNRSVKRKSFTPEVLMQNVAKTLISDFRASSGDPTMYCSHLSALSRGDVGEIRATIPKLDVLNSHPAQFKRDYQIASLFKRYRFEKDLFSDAELVDSSIQKFMDVQSHIANHTLNTVSAFTDRVLSAAAVYISKVLGKYSDEEHRDLCRFGRRASVGVPSRLACEAARWELPLSGSPEQISWFDSEMSHIDCVQEYWINQLDSDPNRSNYQETSSLKLTLVPKTFKSLRAIMPNTTIGSYMSHGLGIIMRNRLKRIGYNLSTLQERHRLLAQRGSVTGYYVTADLSSASDTISVALVNRLFPKDWCDILHRSRIGTVVLPNGCAVESQTFCTMGIGYTFPLQTLVFLALLKSINAIMFNRVRCTISVYGDDMIYPRHLHETVARVLGEVGFIMNVDKTFCEGDFRESCGGDYYRGVDVRPFQPQNGPASVGSKTYEAILYKILNGLLRRWSEYEIGATIEYIMSELGRTAGVAKLVPGDFPDDAGIRCPTLRHWSFLTSRTDVATPKNMGHGIYRFSYLRFTANKREETRHEPYLWLALNGGSRAPSGDLREPIAVGHPLTKLINNLCGCDVQVGPLIWGPHPDDLTVRSNITGRRLRRLASYVVDFGTGRYKRQSGFSCFESRS